MRSLKVDKSPLAIPSLDLPLYLKSVVSSKISDHNKEPTPATEEDFLKENLLILEHALKGTGPPENNENTHEQDFKDPPMEHESETNISRKITEVRENMDINVNSDSSQMLSINEAVHANEAIDQKVDEIQAIEMEASNQEIVDESQTIDHKIVNDIQGIDQVTVQKRVAIEQDTVHEIQVKTKPEVETIHDENTNISIIVDMKNSSPSSNEHMNIPLDASELDTSSQNLIETNISDHSNDNDQKMESMKYDVDENDHAKISCATNTLEDNSDTIIHTNLSNNLHEEENAFLQSDEKELKQDELSDSDLKDLDDLDLEDLKDDSEPSDSYMVQVSIEEAVPDNVQNTHIDPIEKCDKNYGEQINMPDVKGTESVKIPSESSIINHESNQESSVSLAQEAINKEFEIEDKETRKTEQCQNITPTSQELEVKTDSNAQKESKNPATNDSDIINLDTSIEPIQVIPENNQDNPVSLEPEVVNNDLEEVYKDTNVTQTSMELDVSIDSNAQKESKDPVTKDSHNDNLEATNIKPVQSVHESNQDTAVSLELEVINNDLEKLGQIKGKTEQCQNAQQAMELEESSVNNTQKDPATIVWENSVARLKIKSSKVINSEFAKTSSIEENIGKVPIVWGSQNPDANINTHVATPKWDLLSKSTPINDNMNQNGPFFAKKSNTRWDTTSASKNAPVNQNVDQNASGTAKKVQQNVWESPQTTDVAKLFWQTNAKINQSPVYSVYQSTVSAPAVTWEANPERSPTPSVIHDVCVSSAKCKNPNRDSQSPCSIIEEVNMDIESDKVDTPDNEHYELIPQSQVYSGYNTTFKSYITNKGVLHFNHLPKSETWSPSRIKTLIANATNNDMAVVNNIAHILVERHHKCMRKAFVKFRDLGCAAKALDCLRNISENNLLQLMEGLNRIFVNFSRAKYIEWDENNYPIYREPHPLANQGLPFGNKYVSGASPHNALPEKPAAPSAAHDELTPAFVKPRCPPFVSCLDPTDTRYYGLSRDFLDSLHIKVFPLTTTVLVNNLDTMHENQIRNVFSMAGTIHAVYLYVYPTNMSAWIRYDHPLEAVQAISMFNHQKINGGRVVSLMMVPSKIPRSFKIKYPLGVSKVGPGLGPKGTIIEGVRTTIELALLKNQCEKEIAAISKTLYETRKILDEKTKELNTKTLVRVMSNSMQNPLIALGLFGVQQGLMHRFTSQDPEPMNSAQVNAVQNTVQNQSAQSTVQNQMAQNPVQNKMAQNTVQNQMAQNPGQNQIAQNPVQNQMAQNTVQNQRPQNTVQNQRAQNTVQIQSAQKTVPNQRAQNTVQNQRAQNPVQNQMAQNPVQNPEPKWSSPAVPVWSQPDPKFTPNMQLSPQPGPSQPVPESQPVPQETLIYQQYPKFMNQAGPIIPNPLPPGQIMPGSYIPGQLVPNFVPEQIPAVQPIQYPQSIQPIPHSQPVQHPQPFQHPQPVQHPVQPIQHHQPVQHPQPVLHPDQPVQYPQPVPPPDQPIQYPQPVPHPDQPIQYPQSVPHPQSTQPIQNSQSRFNLVQIPIADPVPTSEPLNTPLHKIDKPLPKSKVGQFLRDIPIAVDNPKTDLDSIPIPFDKSPTITDVRARVSKKLAALKLPPLRLTNPPKGKPVPAKPVPVSSRDARPKGKVKRSRSRSGSSSSSDSDRPKKYRKSPERGFKRAPEKDSRWDKKQDETTFLQFKFLPPSVSTQDLRDKMTELGRLTSVVMIGKGNALVGFRRKRDADTCIEMYDRSKVDDQYISVTLHVPDRRH